MDQIGLQISRCSEITRAILKFGRQDEPKPQDIILKDFIPEVTGMVAQRAVVHGISIEQEIAENTYLVHGDPIQLQQVFVNLYNNAIDAILERHGTSGGRLMIKAGPKQNNRVEIRVIDNGGGISPENLNRIFSPFFTTKSVGKGTGLGLWICYGIINDMRGSMEVSSDVGAGTTVTILLPAAV